MATVADSSLTAFASEQGKEFFTKAKKTRDPLDDYQLTSQIREMVHIAREARRPLIEEWEHNYAMLTNNYWTKEYRSSWRAAAEVPEIWPIIASLVGWMTDQRPEFEASCTSELASQHADFFDTLADHLEILLNTSYSLNFEEAETRKALWDAYVYGTGFLKTVWNPSLADGLGDAQTQRRDPWSVYPDPNASGMDDLEHIVEVYNSSISALDRKFPGAAEKLRASGPERIEEQPTQTDKSASRRVNPGRGLNPGKMSTPGSTSYGSGASSGKTDSMYFNHQGVTVYEAWFREHEIIEIPTSDPDKMQKSVRERWRVVVMADDVILMDEPADKLWSHRGHPYDRIVLQDLGEFWGESLVSLLISAQELLNKMLVAVVQNVDLVGNPILIEPKEAGISKAKKHNRPGETLQANAGSASAIQWLNPPSLHQAIPEMIRYLQDRIEAISGLSSIAKGQAPGGRPSEGTADSMQEASFVRVRMAQRELEKALQSAGRKKASLIIDNYTTARTVAVLGPGGEKTHLGLRARHFQAATEKGAAPLAFTIKVDAGSQRDTSRSSVRAMYERLYAIGAISEEKLLIAMDVPGAKAEAEKVQKLRQESALNEKTQKDKSRR